MVKIGANPSDLSGQSPLDEGPKGSSGSFKLESKKTHTPNLQKHQSLDGYKNVPQGSNELYDNLKELTELYAELKNNKEKGFDSITDQEMETLIRLKTKLEALSKSTSFKSSDNYNIRYQLPQLLSALQQGIQAGSGVPVNNGLVRICIDRAIDFMIY